MKNNSIGIFDSGVGGLTVLHSLAQALPNESFIYYGDNARAPYGNRSKEELLLFNQEIIDFLISQKVKLIVMACNTSCAVVLNHITNDYPVPIVGLIDRAAKEAANKTQNKRIAVLATAQTVKSEAYIHACQSFNTDLEIIQVPCPDLVPIVENMQVETVLGQEKALKYFDTALDFNADTLIYGCSHYPYFENTFKKHSNQIKNFINPASSIVPIIKKSLVDLNLENNEANSQGKIQYYVSGDKEKFHKFLAHYFNVQNPKLTSHQFQLVNSI